MSDTHDNGREEQWYGGRFPQLINVHLQRGAVTLKTTADVQDYLNALEDELKTARAQAGLALAAATARADEWKTRTANVSRLLDEANQRAFDEQDRLQAELQQATARAEAAERERDEWVLMYPRSVELPEQFLASLIKRNAGLLADRDEAVGLVERIFRKFKQNRKDVGQDWVSAPPRSWEDGWMNDAAALLDRLPSATET